MTSSDEMDYSATLQDPSKPVPPLTETDYDRHYANVHRSNAKQLNLTHSKSNNSRRQSTPAPFRHRELRPEDFGESGRYASLSQERVERDDQTGVDEERDNPKRCQIPATSKHVLKNTLEMLNCIGAALTLDTNDTIRVFSYDFNPENVFMHTSPVRSRCTTTFVEGCPECNQIVGEQRHKKAL